MKLRRLNEVKQAIGLSRSTMYNLMTPTSPYYDPTFPKPVKIGKRAIAWREHEINAWISSLVSSTMTDAGIDEVVPQPFAPLCNSLTVTNKVAHKLVIS